MIGLEYLLNIHNISQQQLAEPLGIKQQNIDKWVRGIKKIPLKHLPKLSEIFKVPKEYFQKELTNLDKIELSRMQILNSSGVREYESIVTDSSGNKNKQTILINEGIDITSLKLLDMEKEILLIQERVQKNISDKMLNDSEHFSSNVYLLYKMFNQIIEQNCIREDVLEDILNSIISLKDNKKTKNEFNKVVSEIIKTEQVKRDEKDRLYLQQDYSINDELNGYESEQQQISQEEKERRKIMCKLFK